MTLSSSTVRGTLPRTRATSWLAIMALMRPFLCLPHLISGFSPLCSTVVQVSRSSSSSHRRHTDTMEAMIPNRNIHRPTTTTTARRTRSTFRCLHPQEPHDGDSTRKVAPVRAETTTTTTTTTLTDDYDTLTLQELQSRFDDVLLHYRNTQEMTPSAVCHAMLRTRLELTGQLDRCHVGTSTVADAGLGLFASRDILEGELITCFPGDALLLWSKAVGDFCGDVGVMMGQPHNNSINNNNNLEKKKNDDSFQTQVTSNAARSYELKIGDLESLVADPTRIGDAAYLGHMANDKAILLQGDPKARQNYSQATLAGHNAAFFDMVGCHLVTTATKPIAKEEEIFVSYGDGYWMSRIQ